MRCPKARQSTLNQLEEEKVRYSTVQELSSTIEKLDFNSSYTTNIIKKLREDIINE